jgi:hypothetical protein
MNVGELRKNLSSSTAFSDDDKAKFESDIRKAKDQLEEMSRVLHAVYDYKCDTDPGEGLPDECSREAHEEGSHVHELEHALGDFNELFEIKTPMKYRMLFSIYSKLFQRVAKAKTGALGEQSILSDKKKKPRNTLAG